MEFRPTILCVSKRPHLWVGIAEMIASQTERVDQVVFMLDSRCDAKPSSTFAVTLKSHDIRGYLFPVNPNSYGHLLNMGLRHVWLMFPDTNWIINIDDDDFYGPDYVREIKQCIEENPDALLIGKSSFQIQYFHPDKIVDSFFVGTVEVPGQRFTRARNLAGPTFAINMDVPKPREISYNEDPLMDSGTDGDFIQRAYDRWAYSTGHRFPDWAPIYSTSASNFIYRRYGSEHKHVSKG